MLRTIFVVLICLLFAGCDFRVYSYELNGYEEKCKDKGGIAMIDNFTRKAVCVDGTVVHSIGK